MYRRRRAKEKIIWQPKDTAGTTEVSVSGIVERAVLDFAVTVLFLLSAIWMYGDLIRRSSQINGRAFRVDGKEYIIALVFAMVFILDVIGRLRKKYHLEVWILTVAVYGAGLSFFAWRHRRELEMGFCQLGNMIGEFINNYYHVNLPLPYGYMKDIPFAAGFMFACAALFFLLAADICACRLLIGIMPLLVLVISLSVGYAPQMQGLVIGLIGMFLSGAGAWQPESAYFHRRKAARDTGYVVFLMPILITVILSLLIPAGVRLLFTEQTKKVTLVAEDVLAKQKQMEQKIMNLFGPSEGDAAFGKVDNHMPRYRHKEVLQMEIQGGVGADQYLRGYYGTDYINGRWLTDEDAFALACSNAGCNVENMMDCASTLSYDKELFLKNSFTVVKPQSACNVRYTSLITDIVYMPYNLTRSGSYVERIDDEGNYNYVPYRMDGDEDYSRAADTIMRKPKDVAELEWSMWSGKWSEGLLAELEEDLWEDDPWEENSWSNWGNPQWYEQYVRETYLSTSEDIPSAKEIADEIADATLLESAQEYANLTLSGYSMSYDGIKYVCDQNGEEVVVTYTFPKGSAPGQIAVETGSGYIEDDGNYLINDYSVGMAYDLTTTEGLLKFFNSYNDGRNSNQLRFKYAKEVVNRLSGYTYNTKLGAVPGGGDAVEYFLRESHEGYCTHFATAGVMILRELGVPARYATGYIAKKDTFITAQDGTGSLASVRDDNAHAWAEIYLDGIGWIPVEMTPGYNGDGTDGSSSSQHSGSGSQTQQDSSSQSGSQATESQTQKPNEEKPEETQKNETEHAHPVSGQQGNGVGQGSGPGSKGWKRTMVRVAEISGCLLAVGGIVAGIILFIISRKKQFIRKLEREIKHKRNRKAVNRMNRWIYRKVRRKSHILTRFLSDLEYEKKLGDLFPEIPREEWAQFMVIVKKAHFSVDDIQDEEAIFCHRIYKLLFM